MADSTIDFGEDQGRPWAARAQAPARQPDMAGPSRTRARGEDDRALARMLGVVTVVGLAMTAGAIYGLAQLLT